MEILFSFYWCQFWFIKGLPRWPSGKESTCQCRRLTVQPLGQEDPLEKETATHSSILSWENSMDRGAWWATVHGVIKSRTRLRQLSIHTLVYWVTLMSRKRAKKDMRRLNRDASQLRGTGEAIGAGVMRTGTFFLGMGVQQTLPLRGRVAACGGAVLPGRTSCNDGDVPGWPWSAWALEIWWV